MIEPIMFVGIGFLIAGLLVIGVIPMVHARAVRLTLRRVEAVTPMSMSEIQADKDQLRAEFAMSTRRLEMSVDQMKAKTTSQLAEIGKKSEAIGRLKVELGEKTAALFALESKEKALLDEVREAQRDAGAKTAALLEFERKYAEAAAELAKVTTSHHEASNTAESQRAELAAMRAQTEALKGQIESYDKETKDLQERTERDKAELATTHQQLAEERVKAENLGNRGAELERQLVAQTTETEILGRRVQELLARVDEQTRLVAEREYASEQLRNQAVSAQKTEADIRSELAEVENRRRAATESLNAEKRILEEQLRLSQEEHTKLQQEIAAMKREAESAWVSERMENAVLRERINDVAAEVAKLTSVLEGPGSPIEAILAGEASRPRATVTELPANGNGAGDVLLAPSGGEVSKGSLADRIRALQNRSSRVPQATRA